MSIQHVLHYAGLHLPKNSRLLGTGKVVTSRSTRRSVFLDRDGTVVEDVHFLARTADLKVLTSAAAAIRQLQPEYYIIIATNQSGIARGLFSEADLMAIHVALLDRLAEGGAMIDAIYYCPHLLGGTLLEYPTCCECRKPKPGMLLRARDEWGIDLSRSFMVGDSLRDVEAGIAAGVNTILIDEKEAAANSATRTARNLREAAVRILARKC